jgi:hypothetical protein
MDSTRFTLAACVAASLAVAACTTMSPPPAPTAVPAPADALSCALRLLGEMNYTPAAGGIESGFIRFEQAAAPGPRVITVSYGGGMLMVRGANDTNGQAAKAVAAPPPPERPRRRAQGGGPVHASAGRAPVFSSSRGGLEPPTLRL